jgi:TonB family protein
MLVTGSTAAGRDVASIPLSIKFVESAAVLEEQPAPVAPTPTLTEPALPLETIDIPLEAELPATAVMNSAPVPAATQPFTADEFAARASLSLTEEATVVVLVEVLADGTVGSVTVDRGSGDAQVDAVALGYVRWMRWIPGFTSGAAVAARVRYGVHFGGAQAVESLK